MFSQMELWFNAHSDASNSMRAFRHDIIDMKLLIEQQDINELLVLIEFILCIILKCQNSEALIEQFLDLDQTAQDDMQQLIQGANI